MKNSNDMDDFEKRLRAVPMRKIPANWRSDILAQARVASGETRRREQSYQSRWAIFSAAFWPSPTAWAGLAAVWALMFFINRGTEEHTALAKNVPPPSPELILAIQNQQRKLAELLHNAYSEPQMSRSPALKPRSEYPAQPRAGMYQNQNTV